MKLIEKIIEGLNIINKYKNSDICSGHDVIYARYEDSISFHDENRLLELNWVRGDDEGSWQHYV